MTNPDFKYQRAACLSNGIKKISGLAELTYAKEHFSTWGLNADWQFKTADLIVDWGNKRFEITSKLQTRDNKPVLSLEDGFIRSIGLGVEGSRPFSMVSDWTGIYYDARRPSDLENILQGFDPRATEIAALIDRAKSCIQRITQNNISKYNHAPDVALPETGKRRILLVDQTFGDLSILCGQASEKSFQNMLADALKEADSDKVEILIKTHPDVISGKKQGYLASPEHLANLTGKVQLISENSNPINLIKQVDEVRVVTSQMGFEACMLGKKVSCYGLPFYAGWGITEDRVSCPRRTQKRRLQEVFSAAYLIYSHYIHPETGEPTELEDVLTHIERQKSYWGQNQGHFICVGFDRWKHSYVRHYLKSNQNHIEFSSELSEQQIRPDSKIIIWGNNISAPSKALAESHSLPLMTMEDGFLRSINLGKYGTQPRSLVLDSGGIYFDPESASDLEKLLAESAFSEQELARAERIRERMVAQKISKYNVGQHNPLRLQASADQKIILVPGQVGIDASIAKGCDRVATNIDLLKEVRKLNPETYVVFKPHPDVVSGNIDEPHDNHSEFADQIETGISIHSCLAVADEVHTMTSLVGFEALLLEKPVHTYGRPFYAGWGLTIDHSKQPIPRRQRHLTLAELVAGTLIRYPRYIDPDTGEFISAERTLIALEEELKQNGTAKLSGNRLTRWLLKARYGGLGIWRSWFS